MSFKHSNLARQFFNSVLRAKGVDQPTIDFVWEHGESLYLWQQSFGSLTKAQLEQLAEVALEVNAPVSALPDLALEHGPTLKYRRYILMGGINPYVETFIPGCNDIDVENMEDFVRWIDTEWQEIPL